MKKIKFLAILSILLLSSSLMTNNVWADNAADSETVITDELEIEASAESESECEVEGPYGQCSTSADADVSIKVTWLDQDTILYHAPADTALDLKSTLVASSTILSGLVAMMIKLKNKWA